MKGLVISRLLFALTLAVLGSCSSPLKGWNPNDYTVKSGDTLFSIAWRYEIDPQNLVEWNRLQSASLIYPGQRLHTRKPKGFDNRARQKPVDDADAEMIEVVPAAIPVKQKARKNTVVVQKNDTLYSIARANNTSTAQLISANGLNKPYRIYPGQKLKLQKTTRTDKEVAAKKPAQRSSPPKKTRLTWRWPVKGKIIKRFNRRKLNARGIDIKGRAGTDIKAAASGKVVYSGNGLISYGNLVIIKHNNTYLSAYANNRNLLVKEGEYVKQGQVIAKLGDSSSKNPFLHFEIRKRGKPVNPLSYLPSS